MGGSSGGFTTVSSSWEIINNWVCGSFAETYRSPLLGERIGQILEAVQPDVVHVHNLLNLSFDLPRLAHAANAAVVATLHDYTLVCPSGGQRIHRSANHVCHEIDTERCARCFGESPFHTLMATGQIVASAPAPGDLVKDPFGRLAALDARSGTVWREHERHALTLKMTRGDDAG